MTLIQRFSCAVLLVFLPAFMQAQSGREGLINEKDLSFLAQLTRDVLDSSRILPGQVVGKGFGENRTGGTLVRPGGRNSYPSFWVRDYAMSLPCGFVTEAEQRHMLMLTASTQADRNWITGQGAMVPLGAIADHVRPDDGVPIYFPGTYDPLQQGERSFGRFPPYCDQFYFIDMAHWYVKSTGKKAILDSVINGKSLFERLEMAFVVPPVRQGGEVVYTTEELRGVDFGFRDVITMTGDLLFPSLLKYHAALELADLCAMRGQRSRATHYREIASRLKRDIPVVFSGGGAILHASTGMSRQVDVWGTAYAVHLGVLEGTRGREAGQVLRDAFLKGTLAKNGNIRHVLMTDDMNDKTAWEKSLADRGTYQNGGYWGTPVGWVCETIALVDRNEAQHLASDYIEDLRKGDFRKGPTYGAPWECYNEGGPQNPIYLATVACPFIIFKKN